MWIYKVPESKTNDQLLARFRWRFKIIWPLVVSIAMWTWIVIDRWNMNQKLDELTTTASIKWWNISKIVWKEALDCAIPSHYEIYEKMCTDNMHILLWNLVVTNPSKYEKTFEAFDDMFSDLDEREEKVMKTMLSKVPNIDELIFALKRKWKFPNLVNFLEIHFQTSWLSYVSHYVVDALNPARNDLEVSKWLVINLEKSLVSWKKYSDSWKRAYHESFVWKAHLETLLWIFQNWVIKPNQVSISEISKIYGIEWIIDDINLKIWKFGEIKDKKAWKKAKKEVVESFKKYSELDKTIQFSNIINNSVLGIFIMPTLSEKYNTLTNLESDLFSSAIAEIFNQNTKKPWWNSSEMLLDKEFSSLSTFNNQIYTKYIEWLNVRLKK